MKNDLVRTEHDMLGDREIALHVLFGIHTVIAYGTS